MRPVFRPMLFTLLAYALYISGLGQLGFVGPDEPRYADVAREMLRTGDYVTPHLFGAPWFEKPPLYYWLTTLTFRLGVNELAARLPSAFAAGIFIGFWFWFARRCYGDCAAKFSCLILATSLGWIGFGRAAAMDMLLTTSLSAALALLALWLWEEKVAGLYGFYALLAVATLAKGPLAIALAGLVVLGYIIHQREWSLLRRMLATPAVAVFALIALPWYLLCYARNGAAFIDEFFIKHNVERLVSASAIGHGQPWWFYLPILPAALFPWTPAVLLPLWDILKNGWRRLKDDPKRVLLLYWIALPFVFFSLSENKLPGYLLPILPPVTLWIGHVISEHYGEDSAGYRWTKIAIGASVLLLLTAPLIALLMPEALASGLRGALAETAHAPLFQQILHGAIPPAGWIALAGLVACSLMLLWMKRTLAAGFAGALGVAWTVLLFTSYLSPAINRVASVRSVADRITSYGVAPGAVQVFYLHRNQVYGLGFYLDGLPQELDPDHPAPGARIVAARQDIALSDLLPGAFDRTLFPGQHLRLWVLAEDVPVIVSPAAWPGARPMK
jgi:4-amino-4-deoxy-L-arabinose transferase-like glycosyltransferase